MISVLLTVIALFYVAAASFFGPLAPVTVDGCPPGTFYDGRICNSCAPNTYQPEGGQTECIPCPSPMVSARRAKNCIICSPGQAPLYGNECGVCPPGQYYIPDDSRCADCTLNEFNSGYDLSTSCHRCVEGFAFVRAANCTICPPGETLLSQYDAERGFESKCGVCEAGHHYWPNTQTCWPCEFNTFSTGGIAASCEDCPEGSFSLPGASSCSYCAEGEVLLESGCGRCKEGEGWDGQRGRCEVCQPNHVSDGSTACTACAAGTFARSGSSSCMACPEGSALDVSIGECTTCKAGQYYELSRGQCEQCIGISRHANVQTSRLCEACADGLSANENSTACVARNGSRNSEQGDAAGRRAVLEAFLSGSDSDCRQLVGGDAFERCDYEGRYPVSYT